MKELDKAIINHDIERVKFLLKENVDCKAAILFHIKDALVPHSFSVEELERRGAIMDAGKLEATIDEYLEASTFNYRHEAYLKRLYLTLQQAIKVWRIGELASQELEAQWDEVAIDFLQQQWRAERLPESLQEYAEEKKQEYIQSRQQQWQEQALEAAESEKLDATVLDSIEHHYWLVTGDNIDDKEHLYQKVLAQIEEYALQQAVEYFRTASGDDPFVGAMRQFMRDRIVEQIHEDTINNETIKDLLEAEKDRLTQGKVVARPMPYYIKAIDSLLSDRLEVNWPELNRYLAKQLKGYEFPKKLKAILVKKAMKQLLDVYKDNSESLDDDVLAELSHNMQIVIASYYDSCVIKPTAFYKELVEEVFSALLSDWRADELDAEKADYLQTNLLADVQATLQLLRPYVLRAEMYSQVQTLQDQVMLLTRELRSLQGVSQDASAATANDRDVSVEAMARGGMFGVNANAVLQAESAGDGEQLKVRQGGEQRPRK